MKINSDFKDLLLSLNKFNVEYLLIGGYAVMLHSEPRYTKDIDIWVNPSPENAKRIYDALIDFGAPLQQLEIKIQDFEQEGHFVQLGREPSRIDILLSIDGVTFSEAWQNKEVIEIGDVPINLISRKDLITAKLEAGRPQDIIDAEALSKNTKLEEV